MNRRPSQSGQIVLIVLLVLTIALTVALALIGRTTTDVIISSQTEDSSRAFSAAEAGIEQALKLGAVPNGPQVLSPGVTYSVTVSNVGGAAGVYQFPQKTPRGEAETLWLVNHNADGTLAETPTYTASSLDLCWSSETTSPAVAVSVIYKRSGAYYLAKGAYDPNASRRVTNNFSAPTASSGGCGNASFYLQTLTFSDLGINSASDAVLMLRIRPLYSNTQLAVNSSVALPLQGDKIESTGTLNTGVTRKVIVYQEYRAASGIFDAALYSQGSLSH